MSIRDATKKRGRPATGKGEPVTVRLQPDHMGSLDAWIADHPDPKPSRPEAIREALAEHLKAKGYVVGTKAEAVPAAMTTRAEKKYG